ncbi:hypothetical protein QQF64_012488 [Cirrhinus molitorella]|uniref:Uncharacterized protein n=1 Tax=Cirrhinus molitorella TaxID=172907 RepID=A0ABR3LVM8_9TELE
MIQSGIFNFSARSHILYMCVWTATVNECCPERARTRHVVCPVLIETNNSDAGAVDYIGINLVVIIAAQSVLRSRRVLPLMPTEDLSAAAEMLDRGATRGSLEHLPNVMSLLERQRNAENNRLLDRLSQ